MNHPATITRDGAQVGWGRWFTTPAPAAALRGALFAFALLGGCVAARGAEETAANSEAEIREALILTWGRYDWYDEATDEPHRVYIRPETKWDWNWTWPSWLSRVFEILAWLTLAVVLLILAWMVYNAWRSAPRRATFEAETGFGWTDAERVEALPFLVRRDKLDFLAEARRLRDKGRYGEAIVYLFSFQLVELDRRNVIRLARGKTNRQYLREARRRAPLSGLLEATMVAFEDVFFGGHALSQERFEQSWRRLDEFRSLAAEEPPP